MISQQEHEAWGVLLACQEQLRLGPSGHVIGIDVDAVRRMGAARGCDLAVLSELLPAAEAGLVEALRDTEGEPVCASRTPGEESHRSVEWSLKSR